METDAGYTGDTHSSKMDTISKEDINSNYKASTPMAVVWPSNNELKLYIALFMNKNRDETLLIDNLEPDGTTKYWKRPNVYIYRIYLKIRLFQLMF